MDDPVYVQAERLITANAEAIRDIGHDLNELRSVPDYHSSVKVEVYLQPGGDILVVFVRMVAYGDVDGPDVCEQLSDKDISTNLRCWAADTLTSIQIQRSFLNGSGMVMNQA